MTYNPNIPQPGDLLSDSQNDILNNFSAANTIMGINHYPFDNATANKGKHKILSLPPETVDPAAVASEISLYSKGLTSSTALYLKQPSNGLVANKVIQMTKQVPNATAAVNGPLSQTFYTFLPGNLIMITGFATNGIDGSTINFGVTLTGFYSIHLTAEGSSSNGTNRALVAQVRSKTTTSMVINLQDVNNNDQLSARIVYFTIIGLT